jgi:hypothetical protein
MPEARVRAVYWGQERLKAARQQHGDDKVRAKLESIRKVSLDDRGRLASGTYAGKWRGEAVLDALALNPDPVLVQQQQAEEAKQQAEAAAQAKRDQAAFAEAERQYVAFRKAYEIAQYLDQQIIEKYENNPPNYAFNVESEARWRRSVLNSAGLWNEMVKTGDKLLGAKASSYVPTGWSSPRHPTHELINSLRDQISFTKRYMRSNPSQMVPLEKVQSNRITSGKLSESQALDLSATKQSVELWEQLQFKKSLLVSEKNKPALPFREDEKKQRVADLEAEVAQLRRSLGEYVPLPTVDPTKPPAEAKPTHSDSPQDETMQQRRAAREARLAARRDNSDRATRTTTREAVKESAAEFVAEQKEVQADYGVGDIVEVLSSRRWYSGVVLETKPGQWFVSFDDFYSNHDQWVGADQIREPQNNKPAEAELVEEPTFTADEKVEVLSKRVWYPATVLEAKDRVWKITYDDYGSQYDEWVGKNRIRSK